MLEEKNARQGFLEHGAFLALIHHLPYHLKGFASFGYKVGWRFSEITGLTWKQVDLEQGIGRLEVGTTKNKGGQTVYLDNELVEIFKQQWTDRKRSHILVPKAFPNLNGERQLIDFRRAWSTACKKAGLGFGYKLNKKYFIDRKDRLPAGPTFHDFRKSAVRNMTRAGIPERVAMKVSGHKTRAVFERYNIVNNTDLKMAAKRQADYLKYQKSYNLVTVGQFPKKTTGCPE